MQKRQMVSWDHRNIDPSHGETSPAQEWIVERGADPLGSLFRAEQDQPAWEGPRLILASRDLIDRIDFRGLGRGLGRSVNGEPWP
jgi:hypothetical protein